MQMIFLTGTIPPKFVKYYFHLLERPDFNIFRLSSDRHNISFHHVPAYKAPKGGYYHEDVVLRLITDLQDVLAADSDTARRTDRILVFFPKTQTVESFAKRHNFLWYHSKEGTKLLMQDVLQSYHDGPCNVLVASTSMAQGVDLDGIRYVIIVEMHFGVSTLAQMMGRAGRDEYPSATYFIGHESMVDETDIGLFTVPGKCQRLIMMTFLDGEDYAYNCADAPHTVLPCGVCHPTAKTHRIGLDAVSCVKEASKRVEEVCRIARLPENVPSVPPKPVAPLTGKPPIVARTKNAPSVPPEPVAPLIRKPPIIPRNASPGPSKPRHATTTALKSQPSVGSAGSSGYWGQDDGVVSQETLQAWENVEKVSYIHRSTFLRNITV